MTTDSAGPGNQPARSPWRGAVLAAVLMLVWGGLGLTLVPAINHDEVALNNAARQWQTHGTPALSILGEVDPSYSRAYYWHPPGHLVVTRIAYAVAGYSVGTTRGVSLAAGVLLAVAIFFLVHRLAGSTAAGLAAVVLFMGHEDAWWLPRSGRMDNEALLCGVLALVVWLRTEKPADGWRAPLLSGALIGLGSLFHVIAVLFGPALLAAEIARGRRIPWRAGSILAALCAAPLLAWIALVWAQGHGADWRTQFVDYQLHLRKGSEPLWIRPWSELKLLWRHFLWAPPFLPALAVFAVIGWRRLPAETGRWLAGGLAASFLLIAVLMAKGSGAYPLYWYVWLILPAAAGLPRLSGAPLRWGRAVGWAAIASVFIWQGFRVGVGLYQHEARDPRRMEAFLASHLTPGAVVVGPEDIWYATEQAGADLRIWVEPDPARHDYYVTRLGDRPTPPPGFRLAATLPNIMPRVFGYYFSSTSYAFDLWVSEKRHPVAGPAGPAP